MAKKKTIADTLKERQVSDKPVNTVSIEGNDGGQVLTLRSKTIHTLEGALAEGHVDTTVWDVERWVLNKWDMGAKLLREVDGARHDQLAAMELWQVKVWFKPKENKILAGEDLLKRIAASSPIVPKIKRQPIRKGKTRRALEIDIMDPHLGMMCFEPAADKPWTLEECAELVLWSVRSLLEAAKPYGPFEKIMLPWGNDFAHVDTVFHTTTAGTPQPEALSWHHVYLKGEELQVAVMDELKKVAPVEVLVIPGNHDRQTAFTLGRVMAAYYRNDANVSVDASSSPFKFWRYGTNLVGLDHGHSVQVLRLAALMANECSGPGPREGWWDQTSYREWHLGDQHRKGSAKPTTMAEQGVGVEYLMALTPPNEWHRLKGLNWQKRGATGFVWDHDRGPAARLQVNINSYTGRPTGDNK